MFPGRLMLNPTGHFTPMFGLLRPFSQDFGHPLCSGFAPILCVFPIPSLVFAFHPFSTPVISRLTLLRASMLPVFGGLNCDSSIFPF